MCVHYWLAQARPDSEGYCLEVCKRCGAEQKSYGGDFNHGLAKHKISVRPVYGSLNSLEPFTSWVARKEYPKETYAGNLRGGELL